MHVKPYPTNHFTHTGIDAAITLRERGVTPSDIDRVEIGLPSPVLRTVAEPRELKIRPPSGYAARFSSPFTFAAALRGGGGLGLFLDDLTDERVTDPTTLALAAKVTCVADERCDQIFPEHFPAIVTVHLHAGGTERIEKLENRGSPARPLTDAESEKKFRHAHRACFAAPTSTNSIKRSTRSTASAASTHSRVRYRSSEPLRPALSLADPPDSPAPPPPADRCPRDIRQHRGRTFPLPRHPRRTGPGSPPRRAAPRPGD